MLNEYQSYSLNTVYTTTKKEIAPNNSLWIKHLFLQFSSILPATRSISWNVSVNGIQKDLKYFYRWKYRRFVKCRNHVYSSWLNQSGVLWNSLLFPLSFKHYFKTTNILLLFISNLLSLYQTSKHRDVCSTLSKPLSQSFFTKKPNDRCQSGS